MTARQTLRLLRQGPALLGLGLLLQALWAFSLLQAPLPLGPAQTIDALLLGEPSALQAWRQGDEAHRAEALFHLVSDHFEHGDQAKHRPTELWPMWLLGVVHPSWAFLNDSRRLLRSNQGLLCHQVARTLVEVWTQTGLPGREVALGGHVVAEAYWAGRWHLFDPDYGVQVPRDWEAQDHHDLAKVPGLVQKLYQGVPELNPLQVQHMVKLYTSELDNSAPCYPLGTRYTLSLSLLTWMEFWSLPAQGLAGLLLLTWGIFRNRRRRHTQASTEEVQAPWHPLSTASHPPGWTSAS